MEMSTCHVLGSRRHDTSLPGFILRLQRLEIESLALSTTVEEISHRAAWHEVLVKPVSHTTSALKSPSENAERGSL